MKIAFAHSHFTAPGLWGGVLISRDIASGLATRGHDVLVVEFRHEPGPAVTRLDGYSIHHLAATPISQGVNPLWAWQPCATDIATAMRFLKEFAPDVVYAHTPSGNTATYDAALRLGIPIVHHVHDFAILCGRSFLVDDQGRPCSGPTSIGKCEACLRATYPPVIRAGMRLAAFPLGDALLRRAFGSRRTERFRLRQGIAAYAAFRERLSDGVTTWIATGPPVRDVLCRYGVPAERVTLLPHALPDDRLERSPPPPPLAGRPLRIGYFGRVSPEKGVDLLAAVLRRLQTAASRDFEWWVISGSVPVDVRQRLQGLARLSGDRVRFIEGLRGPAINPVLAQLDVCVIPSLWPEIGPLTLLEALAQGVPCVCNDAAGHADLIEDGVNGFRFRTGDEADLTDTLTTLLQDDRLVERLRTGSDRISGFDGFVDSIEAILSDHALTSGVASRCPSPDDTDWDVRR